MSEVPALPVEHCQWLIATEEFTGICVDFAFTDTNKYTEHCVYIRLYFQLATGEKRKKIVSNIYTVVTFRPKDLQFIVSTLDMYKGSPKWKADYSYNGLGWFYKKRLSYKTIPSYVSYETLLTYTFTKDMPIIV